MRFTFCSLASGSRDINFDLKRLEGYRNFCNKLWNAANFIKIQCKGYDNKKVLSKNLEDFWIYDEFNKTAENFSQHIDSYRFDLATQVTYDFFWEKFCDWYIEFCKIKLNDPKVTQPEKNKIKASLIDLMHKSLILFHPILPFITEEIWVNLYHKKLVDEPGLINSKFPSQIRISKEDDIYERVSVIQEIIKKIRKSRTELGVHPKVNIAAKIIVKNAVINLDITENIKLINNLSGIELSIADDIEFNDHDYIELIDDKFVLYLQIKNMINVKDELNKIESKIMQFKGVINKIDSKLNNKSFIERAPAEIINQNIANRKKIENDILSLESLKNTLSN